MTDDIHAAVARYLAAGTLSADELESLLPDGWDMDERGDQNARRLVLRIIGYLSDYRDGRISENVLRGKLLPFARWTDAPTVSTARPDGGTREAEATTTVTFGVHTRSQEVSG